MADAHPNPEKTTRVGIVMASVRQRIATRELGRGAKLPSIRSTADAMGVSVSTVVDAFDRLAAEGVIQSRRGSGFYVAAPAAPMILAEVGPRRDRAVDPFWISRQSLEATDDVLRPGCGWLPTSWLPEDVLRRAMRATAKANDATLVEYSPPLGSPELRQLLARRLGERGIDASPAQVLITDSGTQAIDLLCRLLLEPGDAVLVDDPCYFNFLALLRAHRVDIVGVKMTPTGPDIADFTRVLNDRRPRLYITNSGLHNPTGAMLAPAIAHQVLTLAHKAELLIIEDDVFADFEETPAPRLAAFDGLRRVVHISSFSKTLSASTRCGYIAARSDWIDGLIDLKIATSFGGGRLAADLTRRALGDGSYRKHVERVRTRLARARADVAARLKRLNIVPWHMPQGGMFLWCRLPNGCDAADVAKAALADGIVLAPGNAFSVSEGARDMMRFNVAQCGDERIFRSLKAALR